MSLKFEARREIPRWLVYGTPLLAIALTILSGYLLFMILGISESLKCLYQSRYGREFQHREKLEV